MKRLIWLGFVAVVLVGIAASIVPRFYARQRQAIPYPGMQPREAQALLAQEWARAHAGAGHR